MADIASLKQTVIDVFLGGKQFELGGQQVDSLKQYDPELEIFKESLGSEVIAGAKARRALIALKPSDLVGFTAAAKAHHVLLPATAPIVATMIQKKVMGSTVPPAYVIPLTEARKKDLLAIEKNILHPAVENYLKEWQQVFEFDNGHVVEKEREEEEEEDVQIDPNLLQKAHHETDEIAKLLAHEKALFGGKPLLNAADIKTFATDKLSFLPNAVRGGDTKKLLTEEKLSLEAIKQYEAECPKGPGVVDGSHEVWKINGKRVDAGGMPLMVWKNHAGLVAYRDSVLAHLRKIRQHLNFWMDQRTTARLDLKSKKVIACTNLAGQVDQLVAAYEKVL